MFPRTPIIPFGVNGRVSAMGLLLTVERSQVEYRKGNRKQKAVLLSQEVKWKNFFGLGRLALYHKGRVEHLCGSIYELMRQKMWSWEKTLDQECLEAV